MADDVCGIHGGEPDPDLRTVMIGCLYDLTEAGLPKLSLGAVPLDSPDSQPRPLYGLRVCKDCRGDLIGLLRTWRNGAFHTPEEDDPERNVPYREDGRTVMLTLEEFYERHPERRP